jgi:hypothetical protein
MEAYFLNMIQNLRQQEEIMLYVNLLNTFPEEEQEVIRFLETEYQNETLSYPYQAPEFDAEAALWAATTIYRAAQLILYRENKETELNLLFPDFSKDITPAAVLSADLTLRFIADLLVQLTAIDSEDPLIELLERLLNTWHYSALYHTVDPEVLNFKGIQESPCVLQLYSDRIIRFKKIALAQHPACKDTVRASLGIFAEDFWKNYKIETT